MKSLLLGLLLTVSSSSFAADVEGMRSVLYPLSNFELGIMERLSAQAVDRAPQQTSEAVKKIVEAMNACTVNNTESEMRIEGQGCPLSYVALKQKTQNQNSIGIDLLTQVSITGDSLKSLLNIESYKESSYTSLQAVSETEVVVKVISDAQMNVRDMGTVVVSRTIFQKYQNEQLVDIKLTAEITSEKVNGKVSVQQNVGGTVCLLDGQAAECELAVLALGFEEEAK